MSIKSNLEKQTELLIEQDNLIDDLFKRLEPILVRFDDEEDCCKDAVRNIRSEIYEVIEIKNGAIARNNKKLGELIKSIDL